MFGEESHKEREYILKHPTDKEGVLFLDIDGVLCTDRAYYASGADKTRTPLRTWDPIGIKIIDRLCQDYNLYVVISSTWRQHFDVGNILQTHGFVSSIHPDDKTPMIPFGHAATRSGQIASWLEDHPEIKKFIIFDDEKIYNVDYAENTKGMAKRHVKTDYYDGILTHHYKKARKILDSQGNKRDEDEKEKTDLGPP